MTAPGTACPSGRCREGSLLIGIVAGDGRVRYLGRPQPVDGGFVGTARAGRAPEMRFRFAEPCGQDSCGQWTGRDCGLVDRVVDTVVDRVVDTVSPGRDGDLPRCGIRRDCRWFHQRGRQACLACPAVVRTRPDPGDGHRDTAPG